jgi:hypothetical protein
MYTPNLQEISMILSILSFIGMNLFIIRYYRVFKSADFIIKRWGQTLVENRWVKQERQQLSVDQQSARQKLAQSVRVQVPFNLLQHHTDAEIVAMLMDRDFMKGALFLGESATTILKGAGEFFATLKGRMPEKQQSPKPEEPLDLLPKTI